MNITLKTLVTQYILKHGTKGRKELCRSVDRSNRTLDRWLSIGGYKPRHAYKLAKRCGASDSRALRISEESKDESSSYIRKLNKLI